MSLLLEDRPPPPPRRLPKPVGLLVLVVLVLVLLGGAVTGGRAVLAAFSGNADYSGTGAGAAVVQTGALVYAAGDRLSAATLAELLRRAGSVRAMELDINAEWTSYVLFPPPPRSPLSATCCRTCSAPRSGMTPLAHGTSSRCCAGAGERAGRKPFACVGLSLPGPPVRTSDSAGHSPSVWPSPRTRRGSNMATPRAGFSRSCLTVCGTWNSRSSVTRSRPPTMLPSAAKPAVCAQSR